MSAIVQFLSKIISEITERVTLTLACFVSRSSTIDLQPFLDAIISTLDPLTKIAIVNHSVILVTPHGTYQAIPCIWRCTFIHQMCYFLQVSIVNSMDQVPIGSRFPTHLKLQHYQYKCDSSLCQFMKQATLFL